MKVRLPAPMETGAASYALLDITAGGIAAEIMRVEYDVEAAARAILASDLPDDLAEQLRSAATEGP